MVSYPSKFTMYPLALEISGESSLLQGVQYKTHVITPPKYFRFTLYTGLLLLLTKQHPFLKWTEDFL